MSQFSGLQEAIAHVEKTKADALGVEVLPIPTPEHKRWVRVGQDIRQVDVSPGLRRIQILTIEDLVKQAVLLYDPSENAINRLGIFVTPRGVQLVFDIRDGRESAMLKFVDTREHELLSVAITESHFSPAQLRSMLRYELSETLHEDALSKLAKQVGQVVFDTNTVNSTNLDRRGESLGASIQRQVQSDHGLPDETLWLDVRRYANSDITIRTKVKVLIDPDHANRRWFFRPVEQSWADYNDAAVLFVRDTMAKALAEASIAIPVLMGEFSVSSPSLPK